MASDRRNLELPPSQTEPVPVNSKANLLLASAELIKDTGGTSAIMYLRRDHTMEQKSMGKKEWYGQIFTATLITHFPHWLGRECQRVGSKVEPGKEEI